MKLEFCPTSCLRDPERDPLECEGCLHLEDIKVNPPIKAVSNFKPFKPVLIVGINNNNYYVEEKMSNGQISKFRVDRDAVRKTK